MAPPPASTSTAAAAAAADLPAASASAAAAFGAPPPSPASSGAAIRQRLIDLRTPAIAHPHQLLTLTCYVPPSTIGSVIGRRGQAVLALQREATKRSGGASGTVRVSIVGSGMSPAGGGGGGGGPGGGGPPPPTPIPHHARRAHADPASEWAPVVIRADPVGAFAAARLLTRDVGGPDRLDDVVVDVPVHRSRHAGLIGRKGLVIAGLSAEHGVRIMVPQKRGGPQVLSAKQGGGGGGGGGGGEEMLFPGTEGSDRKKSGGRGGARNVNNMGGKAAAAAAKYEDESDFEDNDDENRQEASGAGAGYQSHRPTNVNIVQLEGQLDDVEQCLVRVLAIAAGAGAGTGGGSSNAGGGAGGKIKSADGRGEGRAADNNAGANADATATDTKKMTRAEKLKKKKEEKKAKAKAEKEAAAVAAAAAKAADNGAGDVGEVAPEDEAQSGDIPMDIEIKAKDNAAAAAAANDAAAAAKEPKYSFAVVNAATDETDHLMPSLRKLQALAKSTGAKIRRRKIGESTGDGDGGGGKRGGEANVPTDNGAGEDAEEKADEEEMEKAADGDAGDDEEDNGEAENEEEEEIADYDAEADDASPGKQEITITGKTETVKAAISALEDIFGEGGCTYTLDALKTRKKKNGKRGGHQFRGKKKKKGGPGTKE